MPPFPTATAKKILEEELGSPVEQVFDDFEVWTARKIQAKTRSTNSPQMTLRSAQTRAVTLYARGSNDYQNLILSFRGDFRRRSTPLPTRVVAAVSRMKEAPQC